MLEIQARKYTRLFKKAKNLKISAGSELDFFRQCVEGRNKYPEYAALYDEAEQEYLKALKEERIEVL